MGRAADRRATALLKAPCAGVVAIPSRALSSAETVRLWGRTARRSATAGAAKGAGGRCDDHGQTR